jgi:hypothetical protein
MRRFPNHITSFAPFWKQVYLGSLSANFCFVYCTPSSSRWAATILS